MVRKWDVETDVLIIGYGLGGSISAIVAHDAGARVLIIEKMPLAGGNSVLSDGAFSVSLDADDAVKYLAACSGDRMPRDMIDFMARGITEGPAYMDKLAKDVGATTAILDMPWVFYPFPGKDSFRIWRITGFEPGAENQKATQILDKRRSVESTRRGGYKLMDMMFRNVEKRKVEVMLETAAKRLVQNNDGRVVGVIAENKGKPLNIKAKKAVILASGGFAFNDWLLKQHLEIRPLYGVAGKGNTGDGVLMAQKAGAALWHMWLLHGSYGFKFPEYDYAFRVPFGGALNPKQPAKIPWILVNRYGKRFMNEAIPFMQDASYRPLEWMNCDFLGLPSGVPEFTNIPSFMIFDEAGRKTKNIAAPLAATEAEMYYWSPDNSAEIKRGWIKQADTLKGLAEKLGIITVDFENSIERWNSLCPDQKDFDFCRVPGSMMPVSTPPFYGVECWPIVTNTQGGPQFNTRCQVVDPFGEPIPNLYKAGELGSFFGHLYMLSGNLTECIVEGRAAGENAAAETPRKQKP